MKLSDEKSVLRVDSAKEDRAVIRYHQKRIKVPRGTTVLEMMKQYPHPEDDQVLAAVVNNRAVSLDAPLYRSGTVVPIRYDSRGGARIYRRHLTMMLYDVFYRLYPGCHIRVGQAVSEGYYFEISGVSVDSALVGALRRGLKASAKAKLPFIFHRVTVEEARRLFVNKGAPEKRDLLSTWPSAHVGIVQLGDFVDFATGPTALHTGYFSDFKMFRIGEDLVVQFPDPKLPGMIRNTKPQHKLYATLKDSRTFSNRVGVAHVGDLNRACIDGGIREVVQVAEGLHEKRIAGIADEIARGNRRLVLVAGPSSAGKTTFTKRLSIQLRVNHIEPVSISLDNYYVDRRKTPKDGDGKYDFEALEAIDIGLFNRDLRKILDGKRVLTPRYDFNRGKRSDKHQIPVQLTDSSVLIIEGIHGLNDALTPAVPAGEKYRIYINALNPLAIDEHNRLHTSDARLIRRIVRDRHYRGYLAAETIHSWNSVRRGERKHIFPFQESADIIFDSSLLYEFSVLKIFADRYLLEVPRSDEAFAEAYRLRTFLSMFVPILPGDIPQTSLLREFIGGSSFSY